MKKEGVNIMTLRSDFSSLRDNVCSIGEDFILLDSPIITDSFGHPFKSDVTSAIITTQGTTRGRINLIQYTTTAPSMIIIPADHIMEYEYISEDFRSHILIMSKRFTQSLNVDEKLSAFRAVNENPVIPLTEAELNSMLKYFDMMRAATELTDNPYRFELAQNLTRAFFYGGGYYFHRLGDKKGKSKRELLVDEFMQLLNDNFRGNRDLDYYATRMNLTPKYMSALIKDNSGRSAGEWIEERVITEAKVLLRSTNMTIQQISDELGFPDQSNFGRYFKRLAEVSPKEYRNS